MSMDNFLSALDKLDLTDEQKTALREPVTSLNKEKGIMGSDLLTIKTELEGANKQNLSYKEVTAALAKAGIDSSKASELAEKLGSQKTQDDEKDEFKRMIKERDDKLVAFESDARLRTLEAKLDPLLNLAVEGFADTEGKKIELLPDTLTGLKAELYKGIKDGDDDVIVNDRINKALLEAKSSQDTMLKRNGLMQENNTTHQVNENILAGSGSNTVSPATAMQQLMNNGGNTINSAAQAIALAEQTNQ